MHACCFDHCSLACNMAQDLPALPFIINVAGDPMIGGSGVSCTSCASMGVVALSHRVQVISPVANMGVNTRHVSIHRHIWESPMKRCDPVKAQGMLEIPNCTCESTSA